MKKKISVPQKYKFLISLGKILHISGVQSYKIERYMSRVAQLQGIKGSFMDSPTWINYAFYEEDDDQSYNYIECVPPGEVNLGALSRTVEVTNKLLNGKLNFKQAKIELDVIKTYKTKNYEKIQFVSFIVSSGTFCLIMDGNIVSVLVASFAGIVAYVYSYLASKSAYFTSTLESITAFTVTILVGVLSTFFEGVNISLCILSAIIIFIPGLSITTALEELTSKALASGSAKLFDALVSLFKQFFGVILALVILPFLFDIKYEMIKDDIPFWANYIAVPLLALSIMPFFKMRRKDMFFAMLTGFIGYEIASFFASANILLSTFMGTLSVVFMSKLLSKINTTPRLVYTIPGLVMLVPGSKAFIGLSSVFIDGEGSGAVAHSNMGTQVFFIFMGIIGGLILGGSFSSKTTNP